MKIVSIEPTPSPHSMKINVNKELPTGENYNYKNDDDLTDAPEYVRKLFEIGGVKKYLPGRRLHCACQSNKSPLGRHFAASEGCPWHGRIVGRLEIYGSGRTENGLRASLERKVDDPEFEVRMQMKLALERIKGGEGRSERLCLASNDSSDYEKRLMKFLLLERMLSGVFDLQKPNV